MSPEIASLLIMVSLLVLLFMGIPVAFALMSVALIFAMILIGPQGLYMIISAVWAQASSVVLLAIPLFVLMGMVLEFSGIGSGLFDCAYKWFGGMGGGLAVAVIVGSAILSAITGLSATAVVIFGALAVPEMEKRSYSRELILGVIPAGGVLGPLIPPSLYLIVYGMMSEQSVGALFMGGMIPSLIATIVMCIYIVVRAKIQPAYAPGVRPENRSTWKEKVIASKDLIPSMILILLVLGTVYFGIATVTEAAGIGCAGAFVVAIINRQLTWKRLMSSLNSSILLTGMIMWICAGGGLFAGVLRASGAADVVGNVIMSLGLGPTGLVVVMLVMALILGMFMDAVAITLITVPLFVPIMGALGVDLVYFGVVYSIALIIGGITPPFGITLFYFRAIVKDPMSSIYRAQTPFIIILVVTLFITAFLPQTVLWLPAHMRL